MIWHDAYIIMHNEVDYALIEPAFFFSAFLFIHVDAAMTPQLVRRHQNTSRAGFGSHVTLSPWHCDRRVLREVSTPVLLMQMSLAMGQQKVLLHQWCRLQRIRVLG